MVARGGAIQPTIIKQKNKSKPKNQNQNKHKNQHKHKNQNKHKNQHKNKQQQNKHKKQHTYTHKKKRTQQSSVKKLQNKRTQVTMCFHHDALLPPSFLPSQNPPPPLYSCCVSPVVVRQGLVHMLLSIVPTLASYDGFYITTRPTIIKLRPASPSPLPLPPFSLPSSFLFRLFFVLSSFLCTPLFRKEK